MRINEEYQDKSEPTPTRFEALYPKEARFLAQWYSQDKTTPWHICLDGRLKTKERH